MRGVSALKKKRYIFIGNNHSGTIALYFDVLNEAFITKKGNELSNLSWIIIILVAILGNFLRPLKQMYFSQNFFFLLSIIIFVGCLVSIGMVKLLSKGEQSSYIEEVNLSPDELKEFLVQGKNSVNARIIMTILIFLLMITFPIIFYYDRNVYMFLITLATIPLFVFFLQTTDYKRRRRLLKKLEEKK